MIRQKSKNWGVVLCVTWDEKFVFAENRRGNCRLRDGAVLLGGVAAVMLRNVAAGGGVLQRDLHWSAHRIRVKRDKLRERERETLGREKGKGVSLKLSGKKAPGFCLVLFRPSAGEKLYICVISVVLPLSISALCFDSHSSLLWIFTF